MKCDTTVGIVIGYVKLYFFGANSSIYLHFVFI